MLISIIIPHYNHSKALKRCLDSIFRQTFQDFEVIIVDDGSGENEKQYLQKIINTHDDKKTKLILEPHRGASAARNRGARDAQGEFLLFCDADIIMKRNFLEKMLNTLKNKPNSAFAYSSFKYGFKTFRLHPFDKEALKKINYIHTTSLIRKKWFPGFDETLNRFQDWDLWLNISKQGGEGVWIPEILFKVEANNVGISSWLPSFVYRVPWQKIGIKIKRLEKYKLAEEIIRNKYNIN